jgi:short-subunit dehydrogenase
MNLSGRTVLVTGATGGLGHGIARALHARGARLILTGRRTDVLEPLAAELGARSLAVDLADHEAVAVLAEQCAEVDVLVANAAVPGSGPVTSFAVDEIDRALDVNLRAPVVLSRLLAERMAARGSGHILLVSSLAGKTGQPGSALYSATKFGLRGFGQGLRADLHRAGVGVSVVFPGFVRDAGMFHDSGAKLPGYMGTSTVKDVADAVVTAIERNRGEVDVAPASVLAGVAFARVAPGVAARVTRLLGADRVSAGVAAGQSGKR